jgi:hypothetical protein
MGLESAERPVAGATATRGDRDEPLEAGHDERRGMGMPPLQFSRGGAAELNFCLDLHNLNAAREDRT